MTKMSPYIVIVDDDKSYANLLKHKINLIMPLAYVMLVVDIKDVQLPEKPDLILHDCRIPPNDDADFQEVKKLYPTSPLIAISGFSEKEIHALKVIKAGAIDYISKETLGDPEVLERILRYVEL